MPIYFYQVGGYRSHLTTLPGYIPRKSADVADVLFAYLPDREEGETSVTLTHGILPCGASYLLLPSTQETNLDLKQHLFRGRAYHPSRYLALSPVEFRTASELSAKLDRLAHKKKNKGTEPDRDRSQANTIYTSGGRPDVVTEVGYDRAVFEFHRLFYRLCRASINSSDYDIQRVPWFDTIRAFSFAFNISSASRYRNREQRRETPVVLDMAFVEWLLPGSSMDLTVLPDTAEYWRVKENLLFKNHGSNEYLYGSAQVVSRDDIKARLAKVFERNYDAPMLLFVHDAEESLDILNYYGVDTSQWTTAFEPLVGKQLIHTGEKYEGDTEYEPNDRRNGPNRGYPYDRVKSERSRSPRRRGGSGQGRARSRSPQRSPYPVYVVDIKRLYARMKNMPGNEVSVVTMVKDLDVNLEVPEGKQPVSEDNWCAGNECRLLGLIWRALAAGNAIDEQRAALESRPRMPQVGSAGGEQPIMEPVAGPARGDWDDDRDPNDIAAPPISRGAAVVSSDPYANWEDEDFEA